MAPIKKSKPTPSRSLSSFAPSVKKGTAPISSSSSKTTKPTPASTSKTVSAAADAEVDALLALCKTAAFKALLADSKSQMGKPVHGDSFTPTEIVLRVFDADSTFGPNSGVTRLERWERAQRMGLKPEEVIGEILKSEAGKENPVYSISPLSV